MYRSNGNFEAFAHPQKPKRTDSIKNAYIVGSGIAGLAAAVFMVRDAQLPGNKIHILEELAVPGGSLDGSMIANKGFVMRGGREMENHYETLWDLMRSIPSHEDKNVSVLDEFYWLNKQDPNYSNFRLSEKQGKRKPDDGQYTLTPKAMTEIVNLIMMQEEDLNDKKITDVFSDEFFESNFWIYWKTMFAFEPWASAMEMRRYLMRFVHHVDGLMDMSALKFTKYNQYESLVLPMVEFLKSKGVSFEYGIRVNNVEIEKNNGAKTAKVIKATVDGKEKDIPLTADDLIFVTNGSITESSTYGDNNTPAKPTKALGGSWTLWENLAKQDDKFGHPEKFIQNIPDKAWFISANLTTLDNKLMPYIEKITGRPVLGGKTVTGGIVTATDSAWQLSWTINRQPQFANQPSDQAVIWIYALYSDVEGDFIKKPIVDCTGIEIAEEWMYHIGVPTNLIAEIATNSCNTVPSYMPYITSYFMPRSVGDRPDVIPEGSTNLVFLGNFAEVPRDTLFTMEYSVRTAMEGVYQMFNVDRGVPEVFASVFDVRYALQALYWLSDKKELTEMKIPFMAKMALSLGLKKIKGSWIEQILEKENLVTTNKEEMKKKHLGVYAKKNK